MKEATAKEKEALNAAGFKATAPAILTWDGQQPWQGPRLEVRYFHRKKIDVWSGYVRTRDVKGWVENVRIELFVEKWAKDHGGAVPTNDDILEWMIRDPQDEFKLAELGESIVKNGVRQPIVITSNGDLLDGNRRYFAALMKHREAEKKGDTATLAMVSQLPAYVLSPSCDKDDFESVLVEEDFVDSCREEWPNFIKARKVYDAYKTLREDGLTKKDAYASLTERFGISRSRLEYYLKTMNAIDEFMDYHLEEDEEEGRVPKEAPEIKWKAQRYFDHFAELSKSQVQKALETDPEFRAKVFERLFDGDFVNFIQVRKLPAIAADRRARDKFMLGTGQQAVLDAIEWVTVTGVAKKALDNSERIASFKRFLENLSAQEIADLDPVTVSEMEEILATVVRMAKAVHSKRS
jgi:hypothetical protein